MTSVRPMAQEDLSSAADLLAQRHRRHRSSSPLLDSRFEDPDATLRELRTLWGSPGSSGAVAQRNDRVVGYLLGAPKDTRAWGENVWVESAGLALAEGEKHETARDLYACAAQTWVDQGWTAHYALVPAQDVRLVDAWFRLCFGLQHVHAARLPAGTGEGGARPAERRARARVAAGRAGDPHDGAANGLAGGAGRAAATTRAASTPRVTSTVGARVVVRRAVRADVPMLGRLDVVLPEHQVLAPVFAAGRRPTVAEATAEWEQSVDDERFTTFVAQVDGRVVGSAIGCALGASSLHTSLAKLDGAAFLGFAAVLPQARGQGVGRALGEAVLTWAAHEGYRSVVTDWRATNLLSSRTWPRLGFEPTFLRLHRQIGH